MVDRQDIDALLIGSLYGELSSADEARLKAHLESHPADRAALDGLAHARDAVRRSRILEAQLEPPQAVSALLLQEAARRAPRKARVEEEREGWFARLRRSFLMHPAMAAAAMFVVVIGVAGTIYLRKGDHFAAPETAAVDQAERARAATAAGSAQVDEGMPAGDEQGRPPALTAAAAEPEPAAAGSPPPPPPQQPVADPKPDPAGRYDTNGAGGKQANADSYRVGLAEGAARLAKEETQAKPSDVVVAKQAQEDAAESADASKAKKGEADFRAARDVRSGLEVSTPQRSVKDMDDSDGAVATAPAPEAAPPGSASRGFATPASPGATSRRGNAPPSGAPSAKPTPAPAAIATDNVRAEELKLRQAQVARGAGGSGGAVGNVAGAPAGGEDRGAVVEAEASWARAQHSRLVIQVQAGRCTEAANIALALSSRAPGYYQQNVETDRAVKTCLPLINNVREREALRLRAAKRAVDTPAKSEPAKARPATTDQKK